MKVQDFSKKFVIVVNRELPSWQILNTVTHIAAYLGNKMQDRFDTGEHFVTKDGQKLPRNSQYPIIILSAKPALLPGLVEKVRTTNLLHLGFYREMIETNDDSELETLTKSKDHSTLEYLGVGVFGEKEIIDTLTKKFSLWR